MILKTQSNRRLAYKFSTLSTTCFEIRIEFPKYFFVPDKWFFLCFSYNNEKKKLVVYLNSEKIFDQIIKHHLDTLVINKDFLQYAKFGRVGSFAGQLTDLNIWSTILDGSEIRDLYLCVR